MSRIRLRSSRCSAHIKTSPIQVSMTQTAVPAFFQRPYVMISKGGVLVARALRLEASTTSNDSQRIGFMANCACVLPQNGAQRPCSTSLALHTSIVQSLVSALSRSCYLMVGALSCNASSSARPSALGISSWVSQPCHLLQTSSL